MHFESRVGRATDKQKYIYLTGACEAVVVYLGT